MPFQYAGVRATGLIALISIAACSSDSHGPSDPGVFHGASVAANPNNTISAIVAISATGYDSAYVQLWHDNLPAVRTPGGAFDPGTDSLVLPVLGLDTLTDYSFAIELVHSNTAPKTVDTLAFTTGTYPAWIPRAGVVGDRYLGGVHPPQLP